MSEIEKQFYKTFRIKPNLDYFVSFTDEKAKIVRCFHCNKEELLSRYKNTKDKLKVLRVDFDYPPITDHILLELIRFYLGKFKIDRFRRFILSIWIDLYEKTININEKKRLKRRVQALFKENN